METIKRNGKFINVFQCTEEFFNKLISDGSDDYDDTCFIVITGMTDTEFHWDYFNKELKIVYSNYNNWYENVTEENFRNPETINIGDYIIKEDGVYHLETEKQFKNSIL